MENEPSSAEQTLPPEQAAAKATILAECDRLAGAGITFVAVHFDGSGDEGVSEDIKWYATEDYAYEESEVTEPSFSPLQEHFEPESPELRCCPSSLYTFPAGSLRAWLGIAISGFPEFEQFCIAGFPGEHSSFP